MPRGSRPGERRGGRAPGTPNKRTVEFAERLEALNCDPVAALVQIAEDATTDAALRARVYADLLPYIYPKRKAVELAGSGDAAVRVIVLTEDERKLL